MCILCQIICSWGGARTIENLGGLRNLFLLSNEQQNSKDTIHQIDLPQVMLDGAGIKHNATFLSTIVPERDINKFLLDKKRSIQRLNEGAVKNANLASGFELVKQGKFVILKTPLFENKFEFPEKDSDVLCVDLDHKFRIRSSRHLTLFEAFHGQDNNHFPRLIIDRKENKLFGSLHYGNQKMVTKQGNQKITYTEDDVELVRGWPYSPAFYELPKSPQYHSTEDQLLVTSSATGDPQILTPSKISIRSRTRPLDKIGIYLIEFNDNIKYFDPQNKKDMNSLAKRINVSGGFQCLMVHGNGRGPYNESLLSLGLVKLSNLGTNMAYIAYPYDKLISEHTAPHTLSFSLNTQEEESIGNEFDESWGLDPSRFIAHAGGSIDGIPYTNSLEAMNRAYRNGFKMIELDIIQTKDQQFVAAHDWTKWHTMTGMPDYGPVNLNVFLDRLLLGKYTPLDMKRINQWFSAHPDAILVTDKIDDPITFSKKFQYPERLIMELFTLDALNQASTIDQIVSMASQNIIQQLGSDALDYLQNKDIRKVAMSWNYFRNNKVFCKDLARNNIHIYLYGLNKKDLKNEAYVLQNDLPIAYGIYAEEWKF